MGHKGCRTARLTIHDGGSMENDAPAGRLYFPSPLTLHALKPRLQAPDPD